MRGNRVRIDCGALEVSEEVLAELVGLARLDRGQRLAVAKGNAGGGWVADALAVSQKSEQSPEDITKLTALRCAFQEFTESYDALRRLVERGYIPLRGPK